MRKKELTELAVELKKATEVHDGLKLQLNFLGKELAKGILEFQELTLRMLNCDLRLYHKRIYNYADTKVTFLGDDPQCVGLNFDDGDGEFETIQLPFSYLYEDWTQPESAKLRKHAEDTLNAKALQQRLQHENDYVRLRQRYEDKMAFLGPLRCNDGGCTVCHPVVAKLPEAP